MEKKVSEQPTTVVMGYEDTQSTYSMDQPPPAYRRAEAPVVKIAKLAAATILAVSLIVGGVVLGSIYIQARFQCSHAKTEEANKELQPQITLEQIGAESVPIAEALRHNVDMSDSNSESKEDLQAPNSGPTMQDISEKLHIPLQLDLDEITGHLMDNNQEARVNCVIQKKKSEEVVTQTPKQLRTPFGNLTTDQRYVHITGETMSLSCRSGNERMFRPVRIESDDDDDDQAANSILSPQQHLQQQQQQEQQEQQQHQHQLQMQPQFLRQQQQPIFQPQQFQQPFQGQFHAPPQHMQIQAQQHQPMMPNGPPLMMGPLGHPPPHAAILMDPHGMREPRSEHNRAKRRVQQCSCSCEA